MLKKIMRDWPWLIEKLASFIKYLSPKIIYRKYKTALSIFHEFVSRKKVIKTSKNELVEIPYKKTRIVASIVDKFTSKQASIDNLELITESLKKNDIEYFVVPGFSKIRYRIGIPREDRNKFFEVIKKEHDMSGLYMGVLRKRVVVKHTTLVKDESIRRRIRKARVVRFCKFSVDKNERAFAGMKYGCDVEFWRKGDNISEQDALLIGPKLGISIPIEDLPGSIVGPRRNKFSPFLTKSNQVKSTIMINGKKHPTYNCFTNKHIDDIDFPVDVVYTWVNSNDAEWQKKHSKYKNNIKGKERNNGASRYTNRDELKYSLRSVSMYGDSIRNIYIVTDNQIPEWLDNKHPRIKVIDHKDIYSEKSALPIFNSHSIGSQLHHIKGLSDRYIYMNDDVFFGKQVDLNRYFTPSGIIRVVRSHHQFGVGLPTANESAPSSAGKNVRALLEHTFSKTITNKFKHVPHPQIKEVGYELEKRYPEAYKETMRSRFRDKSDIAFAGILHHSYCLITGRAIISSYRAGVVDIGHKDAGKKFNKILSDRRKLPSFCLNESVISEDDSSRIDKQLKSFLESYFPFKAPWEK